MTDERRIAERITLQNTSNSVIDRNKNSELGSIANISNTGFMLVGEIEFIQNSVFQLEIIIADNRLKFGATVLWSSETSKPGLFWHGFHIIDISDAEQQRLDKLLETLH